MEYIEAEYTKSVNNNQNKYIIDNQPKHNNHSKNAPKHLFSCIDPGVRMAYDISLCLIVRLWFLLQGSFYIYFLVTYEKNYGWLGIVVLLIIILIDGLYVVIKRKGKEYTW